LPVHQTIISELKEAATVLDRFINNEDNIRKISEAAQLMVAAINNDCKIISCGNGGSCCDAMHFAEELTGRYRENRQPIAAISISDPSHMSCVGNDYGYNEVFARFVQGVGKKGDVLLAITTSGNSANVIRAVEEAKKKGMKVIALTGKEGGAIKNLCDIAIIVEHDKFADRIQEIHIKIIHIFILLIEQMLGKNAS
jgi:D-sedoheptulose 7-phosphate isomerase